MSKYVMYEPTHAKNFAEAAQKGCLHSVVVECIPDATVKRIALAANEYLIVGKVVTTTEEI